MERNMCTETGCKAFCCINLKFPPKEIAEEQVFEWFPDATPTKDIHNISSATNPKGVYYQKYGEEYVIRIIGYCPYVDEKFNCGIEEKKPGPCESFSRGYKDCTDARQKHDLPSYQESQVLV